MGHSVNAEKRKGRRSLSLIYPLIEFLGLILITGSLYGIIKPYALGILNSQIALYPTAFDPQQTAFAMAIMNYMLFFVILGGIIGLWVWIHRTKSRGYVIG